MINNLQKKYGINPLELDSKFYVKLRNAIDEYKSNWIDVNFPPDNSDIVAVLLDGEKYPSLAHYNKKFQEWIIEEKGIKNNKKVLFWFALPKTKKIIWNKIIFVETAKKKYMSQDNFVLINAKNNMKKKIQMDFVVIAEKHQKMIMKAQCANLVLREMKQIFINKYNYEKNIKRSSRRFINGVSA